MGSRGGAAGGGGGGSVEQTAVGELAFAENGDFLGSLNPDDPTLEDINSTLERAFNEGMDRVRAEPFIDDEFGAEVYGVDIGDQTTTEGISRADFMRDIASVGETNFGAAVVNRLNTPEFLSEALGRRGVSGINAGSFIPQTRIPRSVLAESNIERPMRTYLDSYPAGAGGPYGLQIMNAARFILEGDPILRGLFG